MICLGYSTTDSKYTENISEIKQETEDEFEEHHLELPDYVDIKDEVVKEEPDIKLKQGVQENIFVKSEPSNEDITPLPLLELKKECEFDEFTQPDLILAEDLNSILGESKVQVKSNIDFTKASNDQKENCSKGDSTKVSIFNCEVCGKDFDTEVRKNLHMSSHFSKGPVPCTECGQPFDKRDVYLQHYRTHFQLDCPSCDRKFTTHACLEIHQESHQKEASQVLATKASLSATQRRFRCRYCKEDFPTRSDKLGHEGMHTGRPLFQCKICRKNFGKTTELLVHERVHTGSKPFSCSVCAKNFARQASLKVHQIAHSEEKNFRCELCQQLFSYNSSLKRHLRIHRGEKPYKCSECDWAFQSRHTMETHRHIHSEESRFPCSECSKTFRRGYELKRHYRTHSPSHQEALPFQCGSCNKSFARVDTLQRHQASHGVKLEANDQEKSAPEPFKCDRCDKQFARASYLRSHSLAHSDETFTCEVCNKVFRREHSLQRHMRGHAKKVKAEVA